jgi:hypothetical protein
MLIQYLHGAITICLLLSGLFFLRFWKKTRDRLFAIFAIAFWVLTVERVLLAMTRPEDEFRPYIYLVRLFAFVLIIVAIIDKNRGKSS